MKHISNSLNDQPLLHSTNFEKSVVVNKKRNLKSPKTSKNEFKPNQLNGNLKFLMLNVGGLKSKLKSEDLFNKIKK